MVVALPNQAVHTGPECTPLFSNNENIGPRQFLLTQCSLGKLKGWAPMLCTVGITELQNGLDWKKPQGSSISNRQLNGSSGAVWRLMVVFKQRINFTLPHRNYYLCVQSSLSKCIQKERFFKRAEWTCSYFLLNPYIFLEDDLEYCT